MPLILKRNILEEILALTCNRTFQGRFVSGKHTPLSLLLLSALIWAVGVLLLPFPMSVVYHAGQYSIQGWYVPAFVPPLCYVAIALMLGMLNVHERRIRWLAAAFLLQIAVSVFLHYNAMAALSSLLFAVAIALLFNCLPGVGVEASLFAAFASLGIFSFLMPQFLYVLPLFVAYIPMANISGIKRFLAALLGMFMPFWFLFGAIYVWPAIADAVPSSGSFLASIAFLEIADITPLRLLLLAMELLIFLPAAMLFARSSVPGKPYLRKRLMFILIANAYLLSLSWLSGPNYDMFYSWRVPGCVLMLSYILSFKITKVSNIYFITVLVFWLAVAIVSIWMN